ncbi:hypothetical protein GCM10028796_13780 [Ramlibacter monticola]|uniref:Uncharacterized protein n=1 Tax=Ramlibacter monticola TaxID=1926872 RepID=A0A937CS53_9BURK|nr:hypothetical protein [Ramlibacter monticola]MBL0390214.1 hypothetical protein [Ramlibacter monticola]
MKARTLLGLGVAIAAAIAGVVLLGRKESLPSHFIYLLDQRDASSTPWEPPPLMVKQLEQTYDVKVLVRPAGLMRQWGAYEAMFEEFDSAPGSTPQWPLFFVLAKPYTDTKKQLRAAIDERASLQGARRAQLLERLIMVRDTEGLGRGNECGQLRDDIVYARWQFLGIGLLVHGGTTQELEKCLATSGHPR